MTLIDRVQSRITSTFDRLNRRGTNPGGRLPVNLEIWEQSGTSGNRMKQGRLMLVPDSEMQIVVIDLKRGEVTRWNDQLGQRVPVGDARLEIARNQPDNTPLTLEQLNGKSLQPGQELRVRIGDELYTVVQGGVEDPADGFTWFLTLKRVEQ